VRKKVLKILGILKSEKKKVISLKMAEKCFFGTIFALALFGIIFYHRFGAFSAKKSGNIDTSTAYLD